MDDTITDEFIRRIELERNEINTAYDNGYGIDSHSPDTEDSSLEARTDRYGFIHEYNLPSQLTDVERQRNATEKLRERKWLKMLGDWSSHVSPKPSDMLKRRIFKGIPDSVRSRAWHKLLDIDNQKRMQTGVYEKMRSSGRQYSLDLRQIDLDINRTFRDNTAYRKRYCPRQVQLYNVLAAYSIYNTEIGYCQGMSGITALLLMYLSDEESTFWALSELMSNPKYAMHGMFKKDFPKLIRYSDKHDKIIEQLLPKVFKKLKKCNITSMLYTTKWFLQCYLDTIPFSLVLRLWDIYLLKGDNVIIAMSYCILKVHAKRLKTLDMDTINEFLKNKLPEDFGLTDDEAIERLQECMEELKRYRLDIPPNQILPANELPTTPFGHVDKITRERILQNQKKQSMDQIVAQFKSSATEQSIINSSSGATALHPSSTLSINSEESSGDYKDDFKDDLNPSKLSDYDKESVLSDLTDSHHSSQNNDDFNKLKGYPSDYDNLSEHFSNNVQLKNGSAVKVKNKESSPGLKTTVQINYRKKSPTSGMNDDDDHDHQSDIYEVKLNSELDGLHHSNSSSKVPAPSKNVTKIVYHKDNNEFVRNQYGIYTRDDSMRDSKKSTTTPPKQQQHSSLINAASPNRTPTPADVENTQNVKILTKLPVKHQHTSNGYDYI